MSRNSPFPSYLELESALMFSTEGNCDQYLKDVKILPTHKYCRRCNTLMDSELRPLTQFAAGCCWVCPSCKTEQSIRVNSVLEKSRLRTSDFVRLLSCFSEELLPRAAATRCSLAETTIRRMYTIIRTQMTEELSSQPMIGGPGTVVEIDEAKFGKQKYHRGRVVQGSWVLGGIERGSTSCFMKVLPNNKRNALTLLPIIQRHVAPGTTIITDCWKAYRGLPTLGYVHHTVNHSRNFVDPVTGAHTNGVEGSWTHAKRASIRRGGRRSASALSLDLSMFCWMKQKGLIGNKDRARLMFSRDLPRLLNYRKFS